MKNKSVFVFGSNLAGRHGKGAALYARKHHGAKTGEGVGITGSAYAIPTKDEGLKVLPLETITSFVDDFLVYAKENPDVTFNVTQLGTGLAGYSHEDIAPMFKEAPDNCTLSLKWRVVIWGE